MFRLGDLMDEDIIMYTVADLRKIFRCGTRQSYEIAKIRGFPAMKIGGKILVEKRALESWIEKNKGRKIVL